MIKKFFLLASLFSTSLWASASQGVNLVLELEPDAQQAGRGGVQLGMSSPHSFWDQKASLLTRHQKSMVRFTHLSHIAGSYLDHLSAVVPVNEQGSVLGFALLRYAQDDIPLIDEDEEVIGEEYRTFGIQEYALQVAYGHAFGDFHLGGSLHLLYRELDQKGLGIRGDLDAGWEKWGLITALRVKALTSSAARWESEELEYEEPEVFIGLGYSVAAPYFYGKFSVGFDSPSLIGERARSKTDDGAGNVFEGSLSKEPGQWVQLWKAGVEYEGDSGLFLRLGLPEVRLWKAPSFGVGYLWMKRAQVDYSLEQHADFGRFHRISLGYYW